MTDMEKANKEHMMYTEWRETNLEYWKSEGRDPTLEELETFIETVKAENFLSEEELKDFRKSTKLMCGLSKAQIAMEDDNGSRIVVST